MRKTSGVAVAAAMVGMFLMGGPADADGGTPVPSWHDDQSDLAILGTSADTGYGTTGYTSPDDTYASTTWGWSTRFAQSLNAQWHTQVQNYSHNGALASDYLAGGRWTKTTGAVADLGVHKPTLVIIEVGGNEYSIQRDPALFQTQLGTLVDKVREQRPGVNVLLSIYAEYQWFSNPSASTKTHNYSEYANAIYQVAVTKGTALVDLRQYIPPAAQTNLPNPSPWLKEINQGRTVYIHLNDAGNLAEFGAYWGWTSAMASIH